LFALWGDDEDGVPGVLEGADEFEEKRGVDAVVVGD
jgi:hypothetical protein